MNEGPETTGESGLKSALSCYKPIKMSTIMKQRICLHLIAFVALMPCMLVFNISGEVWINFIGFVYCAYLAILLNESEKVRRFVRRYYHEILRMENLL